MDLRAAIVGYEKRGRLSHDAMPRHSGFEVAVAGATQVGVPMTDDPRAVYDFAPNGITYRVLKMMIADVGCEALSRGRHVLSDKPPKRNSQGVRRIREAEAPNQGLVLKFGLNHRMYDVIKAARKLVDVGKIGDIAFMCIIYVKAVDRTMRRAGATPPCNPEAGS